MKKEDVTKRSRKLVLNRETLLQMEQTSLARVAGGYSDVSLCYADQTFGCPPTVHTRPLCDVAGTDMGCV
jgi:hypothetical protein